MSKKKREHIVFDNMRKIKKSIPFNKVSNTIAKNEKHECTKIRSTK